MNWYIGQEIVCIQTHSGKLVIEGQIYTIASLRQGCCSIDINVGIKSNNPYGLYRIECHNCGYISQLSNDATAWFCETLFAPLEYDQQAIEELLENTLVKTQWPQEYQH